MKQQIKENSSVILSIGAGLGTVATAYLAARAGYQTAQVLENQDPHEDVKEKAKRVWRLYIPTAISATATIVCVASVKRVDAQKTLAAQTALAVSQRAYEGYRAQVIEELGDRKDKTILAKVAEKQISENPPAIVAGSGEVLCCELFTGRYFSSDMEKLNAAVNAVNAKLVRHDLATLDDFYYEIHLPTTTMSGQAGWESGRLLELEFSTVLSPGKVPCLAFEYSYVKSF